MNKFYVTEEVADKLKAKGYPIMQYYHQRLITIFPRIEEVLNWLRKDRIISVEPYASASGWRVTICRAYNQGRTDAGGGTCLKSEIEGYNDGGAFEEYEEAALAGIEYVLDNLI